MSERFGELLRRLVPLGEQDVAEVLEEQGSSHRRFGQIALSWGLCQPEHIWEVWCKQLDRRQAQVDLKSVGVDTQALRYVSAGLAHEFKVVPIRSVKGRVILATSEQSLGEAAQRLPTLLGRPINFVMTDHDALEEAINEHYPLAQIELIKRSA